MVERKTRKRGRVKQAIAKTAPTLAAALGGPLAGAAVAQITKAIFGTPDANADEDAISEALLTASPEQWLALREAEQEFKLALRAADVEEARIHASDRDSARERQAVMNDWTPAALGGLIIAGFFSVLAVMVARKLPPGAETEFSIMLGALATMTAAVVNYFFGSTSGSKEKTRLIAFPPAATLTRDESE